MIAESICHIGRCFLFAWRNPGFFYVYFQEVVTHGKPDQGDYGRDRRRYQLSVIVAERGEQFHKEDPEPASGCE